MIEPPRGHVALEHISDLVGRAYASPDEAITEILQLVRGLLGVSTAMVTRTEGGIWRLVHVVDDEEHGVGMRVGDTLPLAETFCGLVVDGNEPVLIEDARAHREFENVAVFAEFGVRAFIGVPLVLRDGTVFGTLCALGRERAAFGEDDITVLQVLARLVAHELEHEQYVARIPAESQQRFRAVVETAVDAIISIDANGRITSWNRAAEAMFGYTAGEAIGWSASMLMPEAYRPAHEAALARLGAGGEPRILGRTLALRALRKGGGEFPIELSLARWEAEGAFSYTGIVRDISERRDVEMALERSEARFRSLVQNTAEIVTVLDADGKISYESPALTRLLGWLPEEVVGTAALDYVHPDDRVMVQRALDRVVTRTETIEPSIEFRFRHKHGTWRWLEALATNLLHDPAVGGIVVNSRDVTDRRAFEARLARQAHRDPLTGLPNRRRFLDQLGEAALDRESPPQIGVLFLDLDDFKVINDSLGHSAGDLLLVAIAQRLKAFVRPGDTLARLGGDEFTFLLRGLTGAEEAKDMASRLITAFRDPFFLTGREFYLSPSIGIAFGLPNADQPDELLRQADLAMYAAKWQGKSRAALFDSAMDTMAQARFDMGEGLRRAISHQELSISYQPIIELASGEVREFEALIRWNHPEHGTLYPDEFIPVAEETGMIVPIGRWVLGEACRQAQAWQAAFPRDVPVGVAVNLAAIHFRGPTLLQDIGRIVTSVGLTPQTLTVEISERVALDADPTTLATLDDLVSLGVHLAIDDFGTGFSGLSTLKSVPVDMIKIDRSFVSGLGRDGDDAAIVRAIIALARTLGLKTTAEGVETEQQLAALRDLGCDRVQGYLFSEPVTAKEVESLLRDGAYQFRTLIPPARE
jgi:diguanylate cyclase (GGDEF)-like protein/PAS domain S-box-containing protein